MGARGSKKAYTGLRTGIYLLTKFGSDRSIVVGCRSWNDRQTQKHPGMTIRLTLHERDATDRQTDRQDDPYATLPVPIGYLWPNNILLMVSFPSVRQQEGHPACKQESSAVAKMTVSKPETWVWKKLSGFGMLTHTDINIGHLSGAQKTLETDKAVYYCS